jgi:hypothetical protein
VIDFSHGPQKIIAQETNLPERQDQKDTSHKKGASQEESRRAKEARCPETSQKLCEGKEIS